MSYQPTGKRFKLDNTDYCLGIAEDDIGMRVLAIYYRSGAQWMAMLPVLADNVSNEDIMAVGSVSAYLATMLPKAAAQIRNHALPDKPPQGDKPSCVAYDLAMDVNFDPVALTFSLNKLPPLSHAR